MRSACPAGKHGMELHMAYFKEKSMLAMAMKASISGTVLLFAASPSVQSCAAC